MDITKKMLDTMRKGRIEQARIVAEQFEVEEKENDNFLTRSKILMEEAVKDSKKKVLTEGSEMDDDHEKVVNVTKELKQFGDVRATQEENIRKTVNTNVKFETDALKFYPDAEDMTLEGVIPTLSLEFQFRYNDPSGDGCYIWTNAMQLTETNARTLGKIRDAFANWRDSITQDGDLMEKLKKLSEKED